MLQNRIIPSLLVKDGKLVKTCRYRAPKYVGDPVNAIKIFNEKEVDEIIVCDISDQRSLQGPDFALLRRIANECFMPLTYGGGISNLDQIRKVFQIGAEKVVINSALESSNKLLEDASAVFGRQCLVASIDVKKDWMGRYRVCFQSGRRISSYEPVSYVQRVMEAGAGEIIVNCIDREGSWNGFDIKLMKHISRMVSVPVIASGGGGCPAHIAEVFEQTSVSAVAIGSMVVYQQKELGVLINFPSVKFLKEEGIMSFM